MSIKLSLVGNPNSGKTTLFNQLTGSNQYVGNWPGVTVERKSGKVRNIKEVIQVTDLPGIYSLSTYSLEEVIAREYVESDDTELIVNIVDASNLERNLFLSLQLLEVGKPMVIALNMMDVLERRGDKLNVEKLQKELGVKVVAISASKAVGIEELIEAILTHDMSVVPFKEIYDPTIMKLIAYLVKELNVSTSPQLHALRFIDEGPSAIDGHDHQPIHMAYLNEEVDRRLSGLPLDRDMIVSDEKYKYITRLARDVLVKNVDAKPNMSHRIDAIVTHRVLAIPLFLLIMYGVFMVAFGPIGSTVKLAFEFVINHLVIANIAAFLTSLHVSPWLYSLIVKGMLGGVGSVLGFLPEIAILFLMLSILEDSGYMSRAAFIMDRMLRHFGLSGKSFIPMILGFGCTVPALMASRTLDNHRDRRLTMMITPFMSCGARFPIYAVMAAAFFSHNQAIVVYSMYILGIVVALLSGMFLKRFVTQGRVSDFLMELPEYRMPTLFNLLLHTWERVKGFLIKAGTVLLFASMIIWFMSSFNFSLQMVSDGSMSIIGGIGRFIAPVFQPLGFGEWRASMALIVGLAAKEAVVSTMGVLYGVGDILTSHPGALSAPLQSVFTPLSAYAFMAFCLLYTPCIAAAVTLKREMNSWKWTLITLSYQTGVAWFVAFLIYQGGRLFGLG
jgi:ferrous iron transport protein B